MTTTSVPAQEAAVPPSEWPQLAAQQHRAMLDLLRRLTPGEWAAPTDCPLWSVKDIACHLLAEIDSIDSYREFGHQFVGGFKRRKELGTPVDGMNQVGVDERNHLDTAEIVSRIEAGLPSFERKRARRGRVGRFVYFYDSSLLGLASLGYLMNTIYTRDWFMHRIDISRATGRELELGPPDRRVVGDAVADWGNRARANVRVELTGPAGGPYVIGTGVEGTVRGEAVEFARFLAGRQQPEAFQTEGDRAAIARRLQTRCPF